MKFLAKLLVTATLFLSYLGIAQETLPIYQDYLSDNVYLVHPAAAGVGECGKLRLTARSQWLGIDNAPQLQTLSFHSKVSNESKAAYGAILFNDKNGYHSQKGVQGTYAYHLELERGKTFNQLSFGLSLSAVQNEVDQSSFTSFDPEVQQIIQSDFYLNADFGIGYHLGGFSSYFTVKNIFLTAKNSLSSEFDALNLRNYIIGGGYFFGNADKFQFEPSLMFQYKDQTGEKTADLNFKVYKKLGNSQLWAALSYRSTFDGNSFEEANYVSPILGINHKRFMFSYTYTKQLNNIVFADGGFHQISLGLNVFCRTKRLSACPNINGQMF